jgi:hypothetical protein
MLVKRAAFIAGFVLAVLAIDKLVFFGLSTMIDRSQFRFSKLYTGRAKADYVVFGNSRGVHSALASALGEALCGHAMNLAYNSISISGVSTLIADYLDMNPRPKAIFVEASAANEGWQRSILAPYARKSQRIRSTMSAVDAREAAIDRWIWSRPLFADTSLRSLAYLKHDDQDWIISGRSISPEMKQAWLASSAKKRQAEVDSLMSSASPERLAALRDIARAANARGVPIVFYIAPVHPIVRSTGNGNAAPLIALIADVHTPNVIVFDGSAALAEDRLFADRIHLNRDGSHAFVKILAADPAIKRLAACSVPN